MAQATRDLDTPYIRVPPPGPLATEILAVEGRWLSPAVTHPTPLVFEAASGSVITDVDGNRFADLGCGVLITNIGHAHPRVVAATAQAAAASPSSYNYPHRRRAVLSQRLGEMLPAGLQRVMYFSSGSEAVDAAVRLARLATGRHEIISFKGAFHGRTYLPMTVSGKASMKTGFGPLVPGVIHADYPDASNPSCGEWVRSFEETLRTASSGDVAAVLAEPYQGAGGVIVPPEDFLPTLRAICDRLGALLIVDEVQSGFGRTGPMFAIDPLQVVPDIVLLGKAIANGLPMSALVASDEVAGALRPEAFSSTFGGNVVCCAAALAVLDAFEHEDIIAQGEGLADAIGSEVREWPGRHSCVSAVRRLGLAIGVELKSGAGAQPAPGAARWVVDQALRRGVVMISPIGIDGNVLRLAPALTMRTELAQRALAIVSEAIDDLPKELLMETSTR